MAPGDERMSLIPDYMKDRRITCGICGRPMAVASEVSGVVVCECGANYLLWQGRMTAGQAARHADPDDPCRCRLCREGG